MDLLQHTRRIHHIAHPTDPPHRMELPLHRMKALLMELVQHMYPDQPQPLTEPALMEALPLTKSTLTEPLPLTKPALTQQALT